MLRCLHVIFPIELRLDFTEALQKISAADRLQKIVLHAVLNRTAEIVIILMAGQKDDQHILSLQLPAQLNSAHPRHLNIRQNDIRSMAPDVRKRNPRICEGNRFKSELVPRKQSGYSLRNCLLIINDDQLIHCSSCHNCRSLQPTVPCWQNPSHSPPSPPDPMSSPD